MWIKPEPLEAGYEAFNGYIFTERDAEIYNNGAYINADEIHRTFCLIIKLYGTKTN